MKFPRTSQNRPSCAKGVPALVALGSNRHGRLGAPEEAFVRVARALGEMPGMRLLALSGLWRTQAVGLARQPSFLNAVIMLETVLPAEELLAALRRLEIRAGRLSARAWGPRALDLDLLDYAGQARRPPGMGRLGQGRAVHRWQKRGLVLPHPAMHARAFVLLPLLDVAPRWRHPLLGAPALALAARLPAAHRAACAPLLKDERTSRWNALRHHIRSQNRMAD